MPARRTQRFKSQFARTMRKRGAPPLKTRVARLERSKEVKRHQNADTAVSVSSSGIGPLHLTGVAQGDGNDQREGVRITAKHLELRINLISVATQASHQHVRFVVWKDRQQRASTGAVWTDVFESASVVSAQNIDKYSRFSLLYDRTFTLRQVQNGVIANQNIPGKQYIVIQIPLKRLTIGYNGASGTNIEKSGLYLGYITDVGSNQPVFNYHLELKFTDS